MAIAEGQEVLKTRYRAWHGKRAADPEFETTELVHSISIGGVFNITHLGNRLNMPALQFQALSAQRSGQRATSKSLLQP
jgi:hypothetical protein